MAFLEGTGLALWIGLGVVATQVLGERKVVAVRDLLGGETPAWKHRADGTVRVEGIDYTRMPAVTVNEITPDDGVRAERPQTCKP